MKRKKIKLKEKESIFLKEYGNNLDKDFKKYIKDITYEKDKFLMAIKVIENKNHIWCPENDVEFNYIQNNSWFNMSEMNGHEINYFNDKHKLDKNKKVKFRAFKVVLFLSQKQKNIINNWLNAYTKMYNCALKYIKNTIKTDNTCLNYYATRKKLLNEKNEILNTSTIKVHDIDYAIKLACSNYKSAYTNYKKGNIKSFRIRYLGLDRPIKIMDLEKANFKNNSIREQLLGIVIGYYNGEIFDFDTIRHDCRLQKNNNEYYLYVPDLTKPTNKNEKMNKVISIDLGVRTFATCISENKVVTIGENCKKRIKKYLKRKDKILKNEKIPIKIKKKNEAYFNKKINNLVDEMHWKSINYLVKNYETILIGKLSSKSIVRKTGNLDRMTKRIVLSLKFYEFLKKLKYKCDVSKTHLGIINEWMTSKMCSMCGYIKNDLGRNKIYNCNSCHKIINRDINGARNIYIRSIK